MTGVVMQVVRPKASARAALLMEVNMFVGLVVVVVVLFVFLLVDFVRRRGNPPNQFTSVPKQ